MINTVTFIKGEWLQNLGYIKWEKFCHFYVLPGWPYVVHHKQ